MSDHLTECIYEPEHWDVEQSILWGGKPCICDRLRQAEQRVTNRALAASSVAINAEYEKGYAAGLTAAREAVAGLEFFCTNPEQIVRPMALAAIDALTPHDSSDTGTKVRDSLAPSQETGDNGKWERDLQRRVRPPSLAEQIAHAESCDG